LAEGKVNLGRPYPGLDRKDEMGIYCLPPIERRRASKKTPENHYIY
jgi:hypothetical protein